MKSSDESWALAYWDPENYKYDILPLSSPVNNSTLTFDDTSATGGGQGTWMSTAFTWVGEQYIEGGVSAYNGDFYYKLTPIISDVAFLNLNIGVFGSCYVNFDTMIGRDAETGEELYLTDVLPLSTGSSATCYSSGIYGEILLYAPNGIGQNRSGDRYIVTKNAVFKYQHEYTANETLDAMAYPSWKHAREIVLIRDQIIYRIRASGFTAHDLQTFMRLDNLPGFQSAVQKIWLNPDYE